MAMKSNNSRDKCRNSFRNQIALLKNWSIEWLVHMAKQRRLHNPKALTNNKRMCTHVLHEQGDQIGRIFDYRSIVYMVQFF
jgi:hypothetical protein